MALTIARLRMESVWTMTKTVTGFDTASYSSSLITNVTPTLSGAACNRAYFVQGTLAFGATVTINLASLTCPVYGEALTPARFYSVHLEIETAPGRYMPGASDGLVSPFNDASDALNFNAGDSFCIGSTTAATIDATHKNVRIINTHGATTLTYTVVFYLGV